MRAIFLFFDPIRGWRRVSGRDSRTRVDWAEEVRRLLDEDYPKARKVKLVCDNLNTHTIASLYEAFPAEEAHRRRGGWRSIHTPRNGSWLNVAEIELSVLARQCLDRRIGSAAERGRRVCRVGTRPQRRAESGRLAVHDGRRPDQAEASLPTNLALVV